MHVGFVGLGRMGLGLARRLRAAGFGVSGFDPDREARERAERADIRAHDGLPALLADAEGPRRIWVMVPAGEVTDRSIETLSGLLDAGDSIVEGGNSWYRTSMAHAGRLADRGITMLDVGTSGGVLGEREGYSLMIGGAEEIVEEWRPVFEALAPAPDRGWARVGPIGAGHFAKMVHNGIEYGMMQAMAEGVALMRADGEPRVDAAAAARAWRDGSIVASRLMDLVSDVLSDNPDLRGIGTSVADSGEGRWAVQAAIERNISAPVITQALLERLRSRDASRDADRLLSALRGAFGGHEVPAEGSRS